MSTTHENPLRSRTALPRFDEIRPEHVEPGIRSLLAELDHELSVSDEIRGHGRAELYRAGDVFARQRHVSLGHAQIVALVIGRSVLGLDLEGVRDRDLGGAIEEAQRRIVEEVKLPPGMRLEWVGEFGNLKDAIARLQVVVPLTLLLIALLLYLNFSSLIDTFLAMSVIPMALVGGIVTLFLTGTAFSVSAAMGFIALFGISVMEGVILLTTFNALIDEGVERAEAIYEAATIRMRPVMMTCVAACVGLFPAAISTGIGSQVQKPLAMVVVGGILLAPILILIYLPLLIGFCSRRKPVTHEADAANLSQAQPGHM